MPIGGSDASSYMSELESLKRLIVAAQRQECDLIVLIDNAAVAQGFGAVIKGQYILPRYSFQIWLEIAK